MASADPYLNFPGNCLEAFEFYKSVLGGEFSYVGKFSDMPSDAAGDQPQATPTDGIMHISLPYGTSTLMGSGVPPGMGTVTPGNACYVCLSPDSPGEAKPIFDGLSEGGAIEMPFDRQFGGDYFGSFTDKYGIRWMVDDGDPKAKESAG